jgi:hypothetical protein
LGGARNEGCLLLTSLVEGLSHETVQEEGLLELGLLEFPLQLGVFFHLCIEHQGHLIDL